MSLDKQIDQILKQFDIKEFQVTDEFPCSLYQKLIDQGYKIKCIKSYIPQRRSKTEYEIEQIKDANRINCLCFDKIKQILKESIISENGDLIYQNEKLTSEKLKYECQIVCLQNNAQMSEIIVSHGEQSARPHDDGSGVIKAHEFIVCDIFPANQKGYYGDMTRTFIKGQPTQEQINIYNAVKLVHDQCIEKAHVGIVYKELYQYCIDRFSELGYPKQTIDGTPEGMIHGLGHGVGLEIHEEPSFYNKDNKCQIGDVFTIEPGLYYKGKGGVRVEDSLYVKEDGKIEKLANYSYDWIIE